VPVIESTPAPKPAAEAKDVAGPKAEKASDKLASTETSDWHKSWGKAEDRKTDDAKHESHMPPKEDLPQAAQDPNDPLKDPAIFSPYDRKDKDLAKDSKSDEDSKTGKADDKKSDDKKSDEKAEDKKSDVAKDKDKDAKKDKEESAKKAPAHPFAQRLKELIVVKPTEKKDEAGKKEAESASGAKPVTPGQPIFVMTPNGQLVPMNPEAAQQPNIAAAATAAMETDPSNAFTVVRRAPRQSQPVAPDGMGNAFTGSNSNNSQAVMPAYQQVPVNPMYQQMGQQMSYQPMAPMAPMAPMGQPMMPNGYPAMQRPMMYPAPSNLPPAMDRGPIQPVGKASVSSQSNNTQQMLLVLRSSLYPSHREWAADQLGKLDSKSNPIVVELMAQAARNDLAPTVRAACVRNLCKMHASTPAVAEALTHLQQSDENAGVRDEAGRALSQLHLASAPPAVAPVIQPAGLK
jgi:hypothetical protein